MKITAKLSIALAAVFAAICFGVAFTGFSSLGEITDPAQLADAKGFAWFWAFLGVIAVIFGGVGVWLVRTQKEDS